MKKIVALFTLIFIVACSNLPSKQKEPSGEIDALVTGLVAIEGRYKSGGDAGIDGKVKNGIELTFENYYSGETIKVRGNSRGLFSFNGKEGEKYQLVKIYYFRKVGNHEVEIDKEIENSPVFTLSGNKINNFGKVLYTIYPKADVKLISITNYDSSFDFIANFAELKEEVKSEFERANKKSDWLEKEWIQIKNEIE